MNINMADPMSQSHRAVLTRAGIQALGLHENPTALTTHCIRMTVVPRPGPSRLAKDAFVIEDILVLSIEEMRSIDEAIPFDAILARSRQVQSQGQMGLIILVLELADVVDIIPLGVEGLKGELMDPDWEQTLRRVFEEGTQSDFVKTLNRRPRRL